MGQTNYYVGTARGLYSSLDPTTSDWDLEGQSQLGLALISDLEYRPADNTLLIGTHGNGMYETLATPLSVDDFEDTALQQGLLAFPNPADTRLNFQITNTTAVIQGYQVFDYTGRIVAQRTLDNVTQSSLDVSHYTPGIYFLRVRSQNNQVATAKFIKR